ncbi:uncharacterized protein LOC132903929 [Amyelois transitella]|uniref:uncharacterized protein LOC132903929 n=1 Tax=Amyelois transitella TaxID=680683 RepID=UPI00298F5C51|nr:uncharacterized protein LOC132903929 [Amyelois transitella]
MEKAFDKLKKEGKNDVEHLVQWMKESKIIDEAKATEDKARTLLKEVANKRSVEFAHFKATLGKLAAEQNAKLEDFTVALAIKSEKFVGALSAAASAFKDAMKK